MHDFTPGDRVRLRDLSTAVGWAGLTATVRSPSGNVIPGSTRIELDEGLRRPDGSDAQQFYWNTRDLEKIETVTVEAYESLKSAYEHRLGGLQAEFDIFKDEVARVATEYAERHGWCSVVGEALEELGLSATRPVEYEFRGRATIQVPMGVPVAIRPSVESLWAVSNGARVELELLSVEPVD